jgi:hypothetical protein
MATLAAQYTLSQTVAVQQLVRMAMTKNALTVVAEAVDVDHPTKHAKRHDLAARVLLDPDYYLMRFVYAICAKDTLTVSSTDALIISEVGTLFDLISGVDAAD